MTMILNYLAVCITTLIFGALPSLTTAQCEISIGIANLPDNFPLLADTNLNFIYPVLVNNGQDRVISLADEEIITVGCPGLGNSLLNFNGVDVKVQCVGGELAVSGDSYDLSDLYCSSPPEETLYTVGYCGANNTNLGIQIGYNLTDGFIGLIYVCHQELRSNTLYSVNTVYGPSISAADSTSERPYFAEGGYYPLIDVNNCYTQKQQTATIANLVGSESLADDYVIVDDDEYLARGHLAPNGDFIYIYQRNASFYFVNAFPQWQCNNDGNWKYVEYSVRDKAEADSKVLTVYTGTYEVMELADVNNNLVDIYLANNSRLPVSRLAWKVAYDPESNSGIAFVMINNPHLTEVPSTDIICESVCDQIDWFEVYYPTDVYSGYTYCCTVSDLHNVIPYAPDLGDIPILQ